MKERIKAIRRYYGISQQELADRIHVNRGTVSNYEIGRSVPSDSAAAMICREFNVSEEWLRTGKGSMLVEKSREDELKQLFDRVLSDTPGTFRRDLVSALARLDERHWAMLAEIAEALRTPPPSAAEKIKAEVDKEVEEYRAQLLAEKIAAAGLSASSGGAESTGTETA